ncbi:MAG: hypothetical protein VW549_05935, partial [Methylophilaceae bacterium]
HLFRHILIFPNINHFFVTKFLLIFKLIWSRLFIVAIMLLFKEKIMADKSQKKKESKGKPKKAK